VKFLLDLDLVVPSLQKLFPLGRTGRTALGRRQWSPSIQPILLTGVGGELFASSPLHAGAGQTAGSAIRAGKATGRRCASFPSATAHLRCHVSVFFVASSRCSHSPSHSKRTLYERAWGGMTGLRNTRRGRGEPRVAHTRRGCSVVGGGALYASADAMVAVRLAKMTIAEARRWVARRCHTPSSSLSCVVAVIE
jgi:hypothetical protein